MIKQKILDNIIFEWNEEKNNIILKERWVCFEDIIFAFWENKILDIIKNPSSNFENQFCLIVDISNYVYLVPFLKTKEKIFLKTIYPSRKHNKLYSK